MMAGQPLIRVTALCRDFQMGSEVVHALDEVSLTIKAGEFLGITGPSGSGKSTLLYLLGGLDRPTSGHIWVKGRDISTMDEDELAAYRRHMVGFMFQSFNLVSSMTALQNVIFPMIFAQVSPSQRHSRARQALEMVGLGDRLGHRPTELSGGQQQRVATARALVNDPQIILADEPTGNLDSQSGKEVMDLLLQLNQEQGRTVIVVSHDSTVIEMTSVALWLHDGKIFEQ